ncbi:hypothetical protein BVRB_6g153500 [Beta vulgaris subsp. vulgaris]|uniref:uncharacterized protein LOC104897871 n=1 Tax=Beta vulgaris subsp. vulgaris TaxID=3555 RepID=UPI0005402359|nr:uncharacterized protein LOC104897871 [Beta vulgaris subsp. vulgaris]KMT07019.1 hypothetical protein BVRB_6g153500 [Beta vulgaris subsp. vulgaris]
MEGLIPMLFKAIKKNKIRRKYKCLSMGVAQTYHIADFYDHDQDDMLYAHHIETRDKFNDDERRDGHRRRSSSAGEYGINYYHGEVNDHVGKVSSPPKQIIKRYRSHRMFSCFTGAV